MDMNYMIPQRAQTICFVWKRHMDMSTTLSKVCAPQHNAMWTNRVRSDGKVANANRDELERHEDDRRVVEPKAVDHQRL